MKNINIFLLLYRYHHFFNILRILMLHAYILCHACPFFFNPCEARIRYILSSVFFFLNNIILYSSLCNSKIFQEGLGRLEKRKRWDSKDRQLALDNLEKFQEEARTDRRGMWRYGDIQSDDEESGPPARKAGGRR